MSTDMQTYLFAPSTEAKLKLRALLLARGFKCINFFLSDPLWIVDIDQSQWVTCFNTEGSIQRNVRPVCKADVECMSLLMSTEAVKAYLISIKAMPPETVNYGSEL